MYKSKYIKYKNKYQRLLKQEGGSLEIDLSDVTKDIDKTYDPDYDDDLEGEDIIRIVTVPDLPAIESDDEVITPTEAMETEEATTIDIGTKKIIRGNIIKHNLLDKEILELTSLDDFDEFTDKYGFLEQNKIWIDWPNVEKDNKGIYIHDGIKEERFDFCVYKLEVYPSWWKGDFPEIESDEAIVFAPSPSP